MGRPARKRRLTLAKELRNSVKAGPRVWLIVAAAFSSLVLLPLLSKLASLLAMVLVGVGLLFIAPVIIGAVLRGLVGQFKEAVVFRAFTKVAATAAPMKPTSELLTNCPPTGRGKARQNDVIEVEAVTEERKPAALSG